MTDPPAHHLEFLHTVYEFQTGYAAKTTWEKLERRLSNCGVNRYLPPGSSSQAGRQRIICIAEPGNEDELRKAHTICSRSGGTEIHDEDPEVVMAFVGRRFRFIYESIAAGKKKAHRRTRSPQGNIVGDFGEDLGPVRRPQG